MVLPDFNPDFDFIEVEGRLYVVLPSGIIVLADDIR